MSTKTCVTGTNLVLHNALWLTEKTDWHAATETTRNHRSQIHLLELPHF